MNDHTSPPENDSDVDVPQSGVDRGRRRLGTLGLSGTAVALMVPSRSAVAGWGSCTGSEVASGNLSRAGTANPCGCSPGFWWNNNGIALWNVTPSLYTQYPRAAVFNTVFGIAYFTVASVPLVDVGPSTDFQNNFGANKNTSMHAVAALLNATFYGSRYPVAGLQTPSAVIAAFRTACGSATPKEALAAFVSRVDIYSRTTDLWCNGSPER